MGLLEVGQTEVGHILRSKRFGGAVQGPIAQLRYLQEFSVHTLNKRTPLKQPVVIG